jgi:parallel beta-helix repeat protein
MKQNLTLIFPVLTCLLLNGCGAGTEETNAATPDNHAPAISGKPVTTINEGELYIFTPNASDADSDELSFRVTNLPPWAVFDKKTGKISGTPDFDSAGQYTGITISASDNSSSTHLPPFFITVKDVNETDPVNHAPVISGTPVTTIDEGELYTFSPNASDADGDTLSFRVANLPPWAVFDKKTGKISGTPDFDSAGQYTDITISVSDNSASTHLPPFLITVNDVSEADPVNHAPVISGTPVTTIDEGELYTFSPNASDADDDTLSFRVANLPPWAVFDKKTGKISGTPDFYSAGQYTDITISVSDDSASTSLSPFAITVNNTNRAPSISGEPSTDTLTGALYSFMPSAQDADDDDLLFSITNPPSWANFDTSNGQLSGTPSITDAGTYENIIISVSDSTTTTSLPDFTIVVTEESVISDNSIFVDTQIGANYCSDYDVATRRCGSGNSVAYRSLSGGANAATSGDIVEIRGGTYSEQLAPVNSGSKSEPITYRNYDNEHVIISGSSLSPAIVISEKSYLIIEGLEISNVRRWMYALNSHHNIIRENTFSNAKDSGGSSKTGMFFQESTFNRILNNVIDDSTQDNIALIKSDNNLIEGNTVTNAAHVLWAIKCGSRNVIRDNYFHNPEQKIGEVYDCQNVGFNHEFYINDATTHNVIEWNVFAKTSTYYSPSGGNGIQYAGQNGIIRHNVFYDNNVGIGMQYYTPEALYNKHNRIYSNTFFKNHCGGISTSNPSPTRYFDNVFVNNIFSKNHECGGTKPYQLVYRNGLGGFSLENNNLSSGTPSDNVIGVWQGAGNTLQWYESNHPNIFVDNIEKDPDFRDEVNHDFRLNPSSQMIDAGRFLTTTTAAGSGASISVADASYFYDGFGIKGTSGDEIQLEGSSETFEIVSVDYTKNEITLNKATSWSTGQGVTLKYQGDSPDLGAFEEN